MENKTLHNVISRGRVQGVRTPLPVPPPHPEMTCGFLIQLVFCKIKKTMWFIGVEVEQQTSAPPPKKNPGSAPVNVVSHVTIFFFVSSVTTQQFNNLITSSMTTH